MRKHESLTMLVVAGLLGCDGEIAETGPGADMVAGALNDGEIASVMLAVNDGAITMATVVLARLTDPAVVDHANSTIDDHRVSNEDLRAVVMDVGLTYTDSDLSAAITAESNDAIDELVDEDDDEVDELYLETQVTEHGVTLDIIEDRLLHEVDSAALRDYLQESATLEAAHLSRAQDLADGCCVPLDGE